MSRKLTTVAVLAVLAIGGQAIAEIGTIDNVPAATLLLPYFEVDLNDGNGVNTIFAVNNASAAPTVAHVVIWTDLSIEVIDFDIFLTGYDVQTVSMRDILAGNLPVTAHSTNDQGTFLGAAIDGISPHGVNPAWDSSPDNLLNPLFAGCDAILPYSNPIVTGVLLQHLVGATTGGPSPLFGPLPLGGLCSALNYGDNFARGYLTIDNVNDCNLEFPNLNPSYFTVGGAGEASNVNQLWGDYAYVEPGNEFAQGYNLVHIEAEDPVLQEFSSLGGANPVYTFYGRYATNGPGSGADGREPLATTYGVRWIGEVPPFNGTDLFVWRDAKQTTTTGADGPFTCGNGDPGSPVSPVQWYPLDETLIAVFDEQENAIDPCGFVGAGGVISPPLPGQNGACLRAETQRMPMGPAGTPFNDPIQTGSFDFGWVFLNLNHTNAISGTFNGVAQSWVAAAQKAAGVFSIGIDAVQFDNAFDYHPAYDGASTPDINGTLLTNF